MSCRTITSKRIVPRSGPSPPKSYWQRPENILTRETCRWCWRATARKSNRRRCCSGKSNSSTRKATGSSRVGSKAGQRLKYASAPQGGVAVSDVYSPCLLLSHTASASAGAGRRSDDGARDLAGSARLFRFRAAPCAGERARDRVGLACVYESVAACQALRRDRRRSHGRCDEDKGTRRDFLWRWLRAIA